MGDTESGRVRLVRWLKVQEWHYVLRASGQNKVYWKGGPDPCRWGKLGDLPLQEGQTRKVGPVRFTEKHDYQNTRLMMH